MLVLAAILFSLAAAPVRCPKIHTPLTDIQLAAVLRDGHIAAFGRPPSRTRLATAWAQGALEGGRGKKLLCRNIGSVGASKRAPWYRVGPARFRAYLTWRGSAVAYWKLLAARCSYALMMFDAGAPREAAAALRRCGYHRTDPGRYGAIMAALWGSGERAATAAETMGSSM